MNCAIVFPKYSNSLEVGIKDIPVTKRYISLLFMGKGHPRENVGTAVKCADSRQKNVKKHKGELHSGCSNGKSEGKINNGGSGKMCNFCSLKGHNKTGCFKKFPEKALAWY